MEQRTIAGRYELAEPLGESTWRATDRELGREVLVRLGPPGPAAALSHQAIRRVYDHGVEDGQPYEVLEYLPGGTLADRGELPAGAPEELAAALAYAHAQGVTHGALDADAVLFDAEGHAKLAGFTGTGDAEADRQALAELLGAYPVAAVAPVEAATAVIAPPPAAAAPPPARRRGALLAAAAVALALAGLGAAYLASSGDTPAAETTDSLSVPVPTASTEELDTTQPVAPPPAPTTDTEETTTTKATTTQQQTTAPATTAPPPPTTAPPPPPPPTTEPPPTEPTAPPPTTEPPPPGTTG